MRYTVCVHTEIANEVFEKEIRFLNFVEALVTAKAISEEYGVVEVLILNSDYGYIHCILKNGQVTEA
jgi:hypothetical protein